MGRRYPLNCGLAIGALAIAIGCSGGGSSATDGGGCCCDSDERCDTMDDGKTYSCRLF